MTGPKGAFTLVALQLLIGAFVLMWVASLRYPFISRGYYRSTVWVLWPLMAALSFALPDQLRVWSLVTSGAFGLFLIAVYSQRPALEWASGAVASAVGLWLLAEAGGQACPGDCGLGLLHALVGTLLVGGVTHGMVLGHWYLNQARLPIDPLREQCRIIFAALAMGTAAGIVTRPDLILGAVPGGLLTFSPSSYWWAWALLLAATAVLSGMVWATVKARSTQSATGLLYIAMVTVLAAQFLLDLLVTT
ncbi:MAG TPA: hypothetical protein VHJ40_03545 [Actinomycetota bacterium]|nr:hypothetical protein [Actinomycetota bacterium]